MGCLTLNASFEPLTILPVERALRLVIDRKAEVLEIDDARLFRSERRELPCPVVIRLVPRLITAELRPQRPMARSHSTATAMGTTRSSS